METTASRNGLTAGQVAALAVVALVAVWAVWRGVLAANHLDDGATGEVVALLGVPAAVSAGCVLAAAWAEPRWVRVAAAVLAIPAAAFLLFWGILLPNVN